VPDDADVVHAPRGPALARLAVFDGAPVTAVYLREPDAREPAA
jgi:hypothetical protein